MEFSRLLVVGLDASGMELEIPSVDRKTPLLESRLGGWVSVQVRSLLNHIQLAQLFQTLCLTDHAATLLQDLQCGRAYSGKRAVARSSFKGSG